MAAAKKQCFFVISVFNWVFMMIYDYKFGISVSTFQ